MEELERRGREKEGRKQIYCRTFKQLLKRKHTCQSDADNSRTRTHYLSNINAAFIHTYAHTFRQNPHSELKLHIQQCEISVPMLRWVYDACLKRCGEALTKRELIIAPRFLLPHPNPSAAPPPKPCTTKSPDKDTLLRISLLK